MNEFDFWVDDNTVIELYEHCMSRNRSTEPLEELHYLYSDDEYLGDVEDLYQ